MRSVLATVLVATVMLLSIPVNALAGEGGRGDDRQMRVVERATGRTIVLEEGGSGGALATVRFTDPRLGSMSVQVLPDGTVATDTGFRVWTTISSDVLRGRPIRSRSVGVERWRPGVPEDSFTVSLDSPPGLCWRDAAFARNPGSAADALAVSFFETARRAARDSAAFEVAVEDRVGAHGIGTFEEISTEDWDFGRIMSCVNCGLATISLIGTFVGLATCVVCVFLLVVLPIEGMAWAWDCAACIAG